MDLLKQIGDSLQAGAAAVAIVSVVGRPVIRAMMADYATKAALRAQAEQQKKDDAAAAEKLERRFVRVEFAVREGARFMETKLGESEKAIRADIRLMQAAMMARRD